MKSNIPIIIGGFYRSGTSLLRRMLDSHSVIHCPPEIKFFKDFYADYQNDHLEHIRFFSTLKSIGLPEKECLKIFGRAFIDAHLMAAQRNGKKRWADKNPENLLYLKEWQSLLAGNFLFVLVVRDPLDIFSSLKENKFAKTLPESLPDKIDLYNKYMMNGIEFMENNPNQSLFVRYENLVTDPHSEVRKIIKFMGENFEEKMLTDFARPERGKGIEDPKILNQKHISVSSVGRWKNYLTSDETVFIRRRCEKLINYFNYSYEK